MPLPLFRPEQPMTERAKINLSSGEAVGCKVKTRRALFYERPAVAPDPEGRLPALAVAEPLSVGSIG
jgi:hypothetical protein